MTGCSIAGNLRLVDLGTLMKRFYSSSVSEDLGCRRGEFSRKHYGSVELLISSDADGAIQRAGRFRVENGSSGEVNCTPGTWHRTDVHLENPEYHTRWYFKYFLGKVHQNYIGTDAEKNPFFLSVVLSDQNNQRVPQYHSILWRKTGTQKMCLPYSPTKTLSVKSILRYVFTNKFPSIQPVQIPLQGLSTLQQVDTPTKLGVVCELTEGALDPLIQIIDKDVNENWPQYRALGDTTRDQPPTGFNSIHHHSLGPAIQPVFNPNMLNRRSFSDVLPESPKSTRKKEEARQAEFVRLGQALKLKTTVKGDATANLASTSFCKKEPWESQSFCSNFPHEVVCADSWGQSLLVSTDAGILLIDDGQPSVQVFDKTLQIKQMHVLEALDLLIARTDKGKDSRLLVFRLSAVQKDIETKQTIRSKYDCRENKLERTKGCHLYAINTHHGSELRIVVAIRNKLLLVTKKYNPCNSLTSSSVLSSSESPVEEFQYIREICLSDPPVVMTLVDGPTGDSDNMICVAYRHQFDLVNESTGESYRLHHVETNKVNFVAAIDVYEDGEAGLLLCYNYVCQYRKVYPFNGGCPLIQPSACDFQFSWNQVPYAVVCAFPYILAFTTDSIEIRLVVNGNLVHTAVVPELQLVASRSDIYFKATAAVSGSSDSSAKEKSSRSSPQTPTASEMPECPLSSLEGEVPCKNLYKIPLSNLVGRSIERPLKSPLAPKVITTTTSSGIATLPVTHSLSLSRMEIKEIASRTRKELLGKLSSFFSVHISCQVYNLWTITVRFVTCNQIISNSFESYSEGHHLSTSSDPNTLANREESSPSSYPFQLISLYDEDIIDLK
uniref:CNH domain-containing protein n=1 Tax=Calidris pygmaea TaxID=425635 RepID=A0A8C3KC32_9CHAR